MYKNLSYLLLLALLATTSTVSAQRFLREGFSSGMDSEARSESKLDEDDSLSGMTREMFLLQNVNLELQPPVLTAANDNNNGIDGALRSHIQKYCSSPIQLSLGKRKGKYGLRAVGKLESGKKLRAFWRQGSQGGGGGSKQLKSSDFLRVSYDDAVRSRLFTVDFEVQLPRLNKKDPAAPSIVYSVAVEPGGMNQKSMVPRGAGRIKVYPAGHDAPAVENAGTCNVGVTMRAGLVDPTWAKGRDIFRKGRSVGIV